MPELILIVEDKPTNVRQVLEQGGFRVFAADSSSALEAVRREHPDLIVLDLPEGLEFCRALRHESDVLLLVLVANVEEAGVFDALRETECLAKPIAPDHFIEHVQFLLHRVYQSKSIHIHDLVIEVDSYTVLRSGQRIVLTRSEFNLLLILASHPGQTFSRDQLLNRLYGIAHDGFARSIDAHIKNLRQKLEIDPANPRYIRTIYRLGYEFAEDC